MMIVIQLFGLLHPRLKKSYYLFVIEWKSTCVYWNAFVPALTTNTKQHTPKIDMISIHRLEESEGSDFYLKKKSLLTLWFKQLTSSIPSFQFKNKYSTHNPTERQGNLLVSSLFTTEAKNAMPLPLWNMKFVQETGMINDFFVILCHASI